MSTASHEGSGLQLQSAASSPDREAASPGVLPRPSLQSPTQAPLLVQATVYPTSFPWARADSRSLL